MEHAVSCIGTVRLTRRKGLSESIEHAIWEYGITAVRG